MSREKAIKMNKGALSNQLLGRRVKPDPERGIWNLKPNLTGEFFGTIEAAWIDGDGNLKIQVKGPQGDTRATWLDHCLLVD